MSLSEVNSYPLVHLPFELILHILSFLPILDLYSLRKHLPIEYESYIDTMLLRHPNLDSRRLVLRVSAPNTMYTYHPGTSLSTVTQDIYDECADTATDFPSSRIIKMQIRRFGPKGIELLPEEDQWFRHADAVGVAVVLLEDDNRVAKRSLHAADPRKGWFAREGYFDGGIAFELGMTKTDNVSANLHGRTKCAVIQWFGISTQALLTVGTNTAFPAILRAYLIFSPPLG
ncbi:hypothetical protein INT43_001180 [Umbelopsis isabellina]|uniref:F-box domain-containing protein n=1 Tax=Mortierella isabellina TaxID=91625 RepID=A0A8H7PK88_MORIS|nr:hypothetical protein INT43_001180 [Umbelopsis isabellina]